MDSYGTLDYDNIENLELGDSLTSAVQF